MDNHGFLWSENKQLQVHAKMKETNDYIRPGNESDVMVMWFAKLWTSRYLCTRSQIISYRRKSNDSNKGDVHARSNKGKNNEGKRRKCWKRYALKFQPQWDPQFSSVMASKQGYQCFYVFALFSLDIKVTQQRFMTWWCSSKQSFTRTPPNTMETEPWNL